MKISTGTLLNNCAKYGALLGLATVVCRFSDQSLTNIGPSMLTSVLSFIIWLVQFVGCILLMRFFMKKFVSDNDVDDNRTSFVFGMLVALFSAILVSAYTLANVLFISPESVDFLFDTVYNVMGPALDDNGRNAVEHLREIYPQYIFFATLIYCFIYGTILSAILSARIPSKDPFAEYRQ